MVLPLRQLTAHAARKAHRAAVVTHQGGLEAGMHAIQLSLAVLQQLVQRALVVMQRLRLQCPHVQLRG